MYMGEFDNPGADAEPQPPVPIRPTDQELLRNPELGAQILRETRQHVNAILDTFPGEDRLTEWIEEAYTEAESALYRRIIWADDPTMNSVQRNEQWYRTELAAGTVTEGEVAASRADMLKFEDPHDDPAEFNAALQAQLREQGRR
jgi:hypothetical protein